MLLLLALAVPCRAQLNSSGKDFYLAFGDYFAPVQLSVSSKHNATVNLLFTADPSLNESYSITAGNTVFLSLTSSQASAIANYSSDLDMINNFSLHISSDSNIVLRLGAMSPSAEDATLIYPVSCRPPEDTIVFFAFSPNGSVPARNGNEIVAHCDNTLLEITPRHDLGSHAAGIPFNIILNEGETFLIANDSALNQTGSKIKIVSSDCENPLSVYSSDGLNYITYPAGSTLPDACCGDAIIQQVLPLEQWDTVYHYVPFLLRDSAGTVKVVSAADGNNIYFDGVPVTLLNEGDSWDTLVAIPTIITADKPIAASQFMLSHQPIDYTISSGVGDPGHLWLNPLKNGTQESIFQPFPLSTGDTVVTVLTLVARGTPATYLNEMNITGDYLPFPGDAAYNYQRRVISNSDACLFKAEEPVAAYITQMRGYGSLLYAPGDLKVRPSFTGDTLAGIADTLYFCGKDSLILEVPPADDYHWSTGETNRSVAIYEPGLYNVTAEIWRDDCYKDLVPYSFLVQPAWYNIDLGNDTVLCDNEPLLLDPGVQADSYLWQDNATTATNWAYGDGRYWVTTILDGCIASDTIMVAFVVLHPDLGADIPICRGDAVDITLQVPLIPGQTALWNSGISGASLHVNDTGIYTVTISYPPCTATDSIRIFNEICHCDVVIPNVFSPNNDGRNDVFLPLPESECPVSRYALSIFNRWGQRIFYSTDKSEGWDGNFFGRPCDLGTYFFYLNLEAGTSHEHKSFKGDISLLR